MAHRKGTQVVLAGFYPPPYGGESVHIWKLASRLRSAGMLKRVVNLKRGAPPSPDYVNGAGPVRLWSTLMSLLSEETILHLHTNGHSWKSWGVILCAACVLRIRGRLGVLTLHSGMSPAYLTRINEVGAAVLRFALATFAHVVCVNDEIRRVLVRQGVPDSRLSVVPAFLGATPTAFGRDERVLGNFRPLLSVVAGTGPEYGLAVLIRALHALSVHYPKFGCVVCGTDGTDGPADMIRALHLSKHFRFLGLLPHERCMAVIARSDLFIRPSLVDGDAVSVREALCMGVPVIASDATSRPAGVTQFRAGDSKDLEEKIITLVQAGLAAREPVAGPDFGETILSVYRKAVEDWR